jgi:GMP synthase-like glutamine amidotransferase
VRALVLQHIACEPPGIFEDVLRERGAELHRAELDEGEPLPDWRGFDAIVAMGGPMSVNDEAELPWLAEEKRAIGDAVRAGKPYWGVCLGVQLLAASLGARVYPGPEPEVGLLPVELTEDGRADPVFGGLESGMTTLQWHGDTFDLPEGAVRLASSPAYVNQAFRFRRAYGVQFHLEVSAAMAREWAEVPEYVDSLRRTLGPEGAPAFLAAIEERADDMRSAGRALFERWLEQVDAPERVGSASSSPAEQLP